jgi:hypothetical protein
MLFIFRKLRRSFFLPGKVRTYCAYAAGEIVLILVGILLALQISEWNQERKDRAEETEILVRLQAEFEGNQEQLEENRSNYQEIASAMRNFLLIIKPNPDSHPVEFINEYMRLLSWDPAYTPNTTTLNSLITTGRISLISDNELNYSLNNWPAMMDEYNVFLSEMDELDLHGPTYSDHYRFRDNQIKVPKDAGPSNFQSDQKALLSQPKLEDIVERHRALSEEIILRIEKLLTLQQSVLTLIDAELAERGMGD